MLVHRLVSAAASTNATLVNGGYTKLHGFNLANAAAAVRYLKIYDKATAPTIGTDAPIATFHLPANSVNGGVINVDFASNPIHLRFGLGFGLTNLLADSDTTALTAADVVALNLIYSR